MFENVYPLSDGVSYNAYLLKDDKTVLFDTCDFSVAETFFNNLKVALGDRTLDYVIVNHMEPDHCATLGDLIMRYPKVKIIGNAMTFRFIQQFFDFDLSKRQMVIKEGDTFNTGHHELTWVMAPMVHWPEAMVTYDATDKILFSADAFGSFGAIQGNLFTSERAFDEKYIDEARRYYTNIVGKYGTQVLDLLSKASTLDIKMICPLHGLILDTEESITSLIDYYIKWAKYEPEINGVMIAYSSIYSGTKTAAEILASELSKQGVRNIRIYDASNTHASYILADAFRYSHLVFASASYNAGLFTSMQDLLLELQEHNFQKRTVALIQNGSWAPSALNKMKEILKPCQHINYIDKEILIKSRLKNKRELTELAELIVADMNKPKVEEVEDTGPKRKWKCSVCGYVYEGDELPEDFKCPLCKQPAEKFTEIE
ncbi:MAG: MBL fold metallo-hydrolase [Erysipelotrichaceae bacterium]|nr:MBL fold metallo-hydrolase [Erysipelotrichaceae bacterium]